MQSLPPKAAVNPAALKRKEDIASTETGALVNDNNKMLARKMNQPNTSENTGAPFMATQTDAAAPAASEFTTGRRPKLSRRVLSIGATGVARRTNLAVQRSSLGKKPKTQLRSVPLRARQLIDITQFDAFGKHSRSPHRDSAAPESVPDAS
jgi:hypothetical protein